MNRFVLLFLAILQLTSAFVPVSNFGARSVALFAGEGDQEGGAAIAKPKIKTDQKTKTVQKQKSKQSQEAKTHDPISRREEIFEEAPMYKLMLLGDDSYDVEHVVERLCAIVDDMDEDQAQSVLLMAGPSGEAMCGKYPMEKAELYKEQLIRSDPMIYSDIRNENE
ncbi:unnamed protein product [Pseudo-nitzschia multistriata]|uniref:Adaptor protein ClpS core domain-containing protein n=1 Tax=Pseudo-nitzschia multistriata TaxID=183589 RepID=A0A448Z4M9_9STRA|nr:unnamed protein product [Pseudo-nitzschia multistriata]